MIIMIIIILKSNLNKNNVLGILKKNICRKDILQTWLILTFFIDTNLLNQTQVNSITKLQYTLEQVYFIKMNSIFIFI